MLCISCWACECDFRQSSLIPTFPLDACALGRPALPCNLSAWLELLKILSYPKVGELLGDSSSSAVVSTGNFVQLCRGVPVRSMAPRQILARRTQRLGGHLHAEAGNLYNTCFNLAIDSPSA